MTALIVLLAVSFQTPTATVSLSETAPLRRLMPDLAAACHRKLHVRPAIENDVVSVSVHDVPVDALLAKIASVAGAAWKVEGDEAWLEQDSNARNTLTQLGITARATRIQGDIDRLLVEEKVHAGTQQDAATFMHALSRINRLYYQIASSIGSRTLAAIPECGRMVFSTRPTPRQLQLQVSLDDIVGVLAGVYNEQLSVFKKYLEESKKTQGSAPDLASVFPPMPKVEKIDIVVQRAGETGPGDLGALSLRFDAYDANGALIQNMLSGMIGNKALDSGTFEPSYSGMSEAELSNTSAIPAPKTKFVGSLGLPATTIDFCDYVTGAGELHGGIPDTDVRTRLLSPEKIDPLTYPAELLKFAAKSKQLQMVASLPDRFFAWADNDFFSGKDRSQISADYVFDKLSKDTTLSASQTGSWLTVSPTDFAHPPVDRRKLQTLCTKYNEQRDFAWDNMAELSQAGYGVDDYPTVIDTWMTLVCPALWGLQSDWQVVRFFTSVDASKLQPLLSGGSSQLHDLGLDATPVADGLIFQPAEYEFGEPLLVERSNGGQSASGRRVNDYRSEPTEVAASGLTGSERVTVKSTTQAIMRPGGQKSYSHAQQFEMSGMTVDELADEAVDKQYDPNDSSKLISVEYDKELALYKAVQIGTRTTITLRIYAGPVSFREYTLDFPSFTSSQLYTLKTLPGDMQMKFDEAVAAAKQQAKDEMGGGDGGTPP